MGTTFKKLLEKLPLVDQTVAQSLIQLDGHIILSKGEHDYRYNILDLHHKRHPSTIEKEGEVVPHEKEWAFGHILVINNAIYFSSRPTSNRDVEEHAVSSTIYNNLSSTQIFDIDRDGRLIDATNVIYIVSTILALKIHNLIP